MRPEGLDWLRLTGRRLAVPAGVLLFAGRWVAALAAVAPTPLPGSMPGAVPGAAPDAGPTLPHGIRGAVEVPDPWQTYRLVGLVLLIAGICALGFWLWWRRRGPAMAGPGIRPDDAARQRLQRALDLLDQPQVFVAEVSAAVRAYLEDRFGWRAPDRTTEEFLAELQQNGELATTDRESLGHFLGACDLVKFAGVRPGRPELEELHGAALRMVNELTAAVRPEPPPLPAALPAVSAGVAPAAVPPSPPEPGGGQ